MADKEFEPEDPFQPVAVAFSTPGYDGMAAMARCFVEEFALMGWKPARIFKLFSIPEFAGSYAFLRERGPECVRALIEEVFGEAVVIEPAEESVRLIPVNRRNGKPGAWSEEGGSDA